MAGDITPACTTPAIDVIDVIVVVVSANKRNETEVSTSASKAQSTPMHRTPLTVLFAERPVPPLEVPVGEHLEDHCGARQEHEQHALEAVGRDQHVRVVQHVRQLAGRAPRRVHQDLHGGVLGGDIDMDIDRVSGIG